MSVAGCITGPSWLDGAWAAFLPPTSELRREFRKLADTYLEEQESRRKDIDKFVSEYAQPTLNYEVTQKALGRESLQELRQLGFVSLIPSRTEEIRVLVRVEELLARAISDKIAENFSLKIDDPQAACKAIVRQTEHLALGDVVGARSVLRIAEKHKTFGPAAISYLRKNRPTSNRLREGSVVEMLLKGQRVRLHFGEGMDEETIANVHPWLVLSHIISEVFVVGEDDDGLSLNARIIGDMGTLPYLLRRIEPTSLEDLPQFPFHDIEGVGQILCHRAGIVEPLQQAMMMLATHMPDELVALAHHAEDDKLPHLASRVYAVASMLVSVVDQDVATAANEAEKISERYLGACILDALRPDAKVP